jgi:hypothetical protein
LLKFVGVRYFESARTIFLHEPVVDCNSPAIQLSSSELAPTGEVENTVPVEFAFATAQQNIPTVPRKGFETSLHNGYLCCREAGFFH